MAKTRRSLTATTFIITALLVSGFLFAIVPLSSSVMSKSNDTLMKDGIAPNSNTNSIQVVKSGDYVTYNVTVGGDAGTRRYDFVNVSDSLVEVQVTSTIWYFGSYTHTYNYSYENGQIIIADLTGQFTDANKIGEARMLTAYGLKNISIFSYWQPGPYSNALRTYYVPWGCSIFFKYYGNDTDGNYVVQTLSQTNIDWLKNVGQSFNSSSFSPSEVLLGAGTSWAAHGGNQALYIDYYDNWAIHSNMDGVGWAWNNPESMLKEKWSVFNSLRQAGLNVTFAGDIPQNISSYDVVVIFAYFACEPGHSAQIRSYIANGGGVVLYAGVPEYFRCYTKGTGGYGIPTDSLSINNPDWLGFTGYENTGGVATISIDYPFGTFLRSGDVLANGTGQSSASVIGANGTIIATWQTGQVFACSHEFGLGRLYYQAGFIGTQNQSLPENHGYCDGDLINRFGYAPASAIVNADGNNVQYCDGIGHFNISLRPGSHNVTFSAWGYDPRTFQIDVLVNETFEAGTILLSINNSAMGLIPFNYSNEQSLLIPGGWTHDGGFVVNGMKADLMLNGTVLNGVTTNVIIKSGIDLTVKGDSAYLWSMINSTISGLKGQGLTASLYENPTFKVINNHTGVVFSIHYSNHPIIQKIAIIVDQTNHSYWMIFCTISDQEYLQYRPMFDQMIMSFSATEPVGANLNNLWLIVIVGIVIGGLILALIIFAIIRSDRKGRAGSPNPIALNPQQYINWNCKNCGISNQSGWDYCSNCGTRRM